MKVILIDPIIKQVSKGTINSSLLQGIRSMLCLDRAEGIVTQQLDPQTVLWLHDRGLASPDATLWSFGGESTFAGRAVLTGMDPYTGAIADASVSADVVEKQITWKNNTRVKEIGERLRVVPGVSGGLSVVVDRWPIFENESAPEPPQGPASRIWTILRDEDGFSATQSKVGPDGIKPIGGPVKNGSLEGLRALIGLDPANGDKVYLRSVADAPSVVETWVLGS